MVVVAISYSYLMAGKLLSGEGHKAVSISMEKNERHEYEKKKDEMESASRTT